MKLWGYYVKCEAKLCFNNTIEFSIIQTADFLLKFSKFLWVYAISAIVNTHTYTYVEKCLSYNKR